MKKALRGFTITEVMLAATVSTIIITGAFTLLQASSKQLDMIHAKMTLQEESRRALFKMAQEIRQTSALQITDFLSASEITFNVPIPSPDATTLVDPNYNPQWAATIRYFLDPQTHQIIRTSTDYVTGDVDRAILANNVTALTFELPALDSGLVTIQISAQQTLSDGRVIPAQPLRLTTQAEARNP